MGYNASNLDLEGYGEDGFSDDGSTLTDVLNTAGQVVDFVEGLFGKPASQPKAPSAPASTPSAPAYPRALPQAAKGTTGAAADSGLGLVVVIGGLALLVVGGAIVAWKVL